MSKVIARKRQKIPDSLLIVTSDSPRVLDGLGYYNIELKPWSLQGAFDFVSKNFKSSETNEEIVKLCDT